MSHFALNFKSCCCHCDVAFIVALLWCRCHSRVVVVPSLSHCCGFVVAVVVSPSHLSWFCRRCCGVAFVLVVVLSSPLQCCLHRRIVTVLLSSQYCLYRHIVAVSSSRFRRRHCGVAFVIALSWCRRRSRVVAVPLLSHRCSFIVAVAVSPSSSHCHGVHCHFIITVVVSPSSLHRHGVVVVVLLSLLQCHFCCRIVITSQCHRCSHVVASSWLWLWSWSHHGHGHHGCGCGHVVVVTIIVASL